MRRLVARWVYVPTLGYNVLLGRILRVRRWWSEVQPELIIGARPLRGDPQRLHRIGVTGVVNLCEEFPGPVADYERLGIEQLWIPTTDFHHPPLADVEAGADFIQRHARRGGRVYVHCKAGRARSATVALWWLVKYRQHTPESAQRLLQGARPHVNPRIYRRPVIQELYRRLLESQRSDGSLTPSKAPVP